MPRTQQGLIIAQCTINIGLIHIGNISGASMHMRPKEVWRVNPDGKVCDTFRKLKMVFEMEEVDFFNKYNEKELTLYRRNDVGFVFQFYNLMPNLTALENVELATELKKDSLDPKTILESVGLGERLKNFPGQLSGGEQQRVSIARAIAKNPKIILCDEPTGALDYKTGKNILKLLSDVAKKKGKTVIIVTHNSALTEIGDKVFKIKNGKIEESIVNKKPKNIDEVEW